MPKLSKAKPKVTSRKATRKKAEPIAAPAPLVPEMVDFVVTAEAFGDSTAVVDTQTGEFVPEGHVVDARYVVVSVPRNPDHAVEKWNGSAIVAKTAPEIAAFAAAQQDAKAASDLQRAILAAIATMFKDVHGNFPNAAQRGALRSDFITVWKQLG